MAHTVAGPLNAPTLDELLQAMADASIGDLGARVGIPPGADPQEPLTLLAHALNILLSDLQQREREVVLQTERLQTLLAHLPLGVAIASAPEGRILFANPAASLRPGPVALPEAFDAYSAHAPAFHEDGRAVQPHEWPLARAIAHGEVVREQLLEFRLAEDGARWASCTAAPIRDARGAIVGGIVIVQDVTAAREARRREAEADAFHRSLLEGLSDVGLGFIVSDGRRVLTVNDAFARMMATTAGALEGLDTTQLVVPEEREAGRARQDARLAQRAPQTFRCTFLRADGTRFAAQVLGKPLRGEPPRFLALVRDLTEDDRAQEELHAARRQVAQSEKLSALGSLVSGVAHEVRTPLTYLHNNLHLLQRRLERALSRPDVDPELRALLPELAATLEATERIERLVDDLRRYTRLRVGAPRVAPLHESVRRAVDLFRATHRGSIVVRLALEPTPDALVDELGAQQVVLNLLANAADASAPGGEVLVRTLPREEGATLEVADRGAGIPPDVLARAFDPFFTTKAHGTGLGLSIVKRIVDEAGGRIDVRSAAGVGTTFRVDVPRARRTTASSGAAQRQGI